MKNPAIVEITINQNIEVENLYVQDNEQDPFSIIPEEYRPEALRAYNDALPYVTPKNISKTKYYVYLALAIAGAIATLIVLFTTHNAASLLIAAVPVVFFVLFIFERNAILSACSHCNSVRSFDLIYEQHLSSSRVNVPREVTDQYKDKAGNVVGTAKRTVYVEVTRKEFLRVYQCRECGLRKPIVETEDYDD